MPFRPARPLADIDLSAVTTGQSAAALSPGSFSIGGAGYGFRTASLTANATLAAGTYSYAHDVFYGRGGSDRIFGLGGSIPSIAAVAATLPTSTTETG